MKNSVDTSRFEIEKEDIPRYIWIYFKEMDTYYTYLIAQKKDILEFLLFPLKDIFLFRGDTNKALKWSKEGENALDSLRKFDLTSVTYDINRAIPFAKGIFSATGTKPKFIQLIHLRIYMNNQYLIFIESM